MGAFLMQEKVWVVTHIQGSEVTDASVFDSKADAENYAGRWRQQTSGLTM